MKREQHVSLNSPTGFLAISFAALHSWQEELCWQKDLPPIACLSAVTADSDVATEGPVAAWAAAEEGITTLLSLRLSGTSASASRGLLAVFRLLLELALLGLPLVLGALGAEPTSVCDDAVALLTAAFDVKDAIGEGALEALLGASDGGRVAVCEDGEGPAAGL